KQLSNLPAFILMNILSNEATEHATVLLPSYAFAEKRGSMINGKGRLQRLNRAVRGPGQARDDRQILRDLNPAPTGRNGIFSIESVYAERRVSAFIQDRSGPNRVGPAGLFQPIADMFKLLLKEDFTPRQVNTFYYWLAPCLAVMPAIITIAVVPFGSTLLGVPMVIADVNVGILFVFAIASLGVYGIVIGGWASNSKYPFLGGIRSSSQMLSYELSLGLA